MTSASPPAGLNALDAAATVLTDLRCWLTDAALEAQPSSVHLWHVHAPKGTDIDALTAGLLYGARPGTVVRTDRGTSTSIARTFGVEPLTVTLIVHFQAEVPDEVVTVLNPATDMDGFAA